MPVISAKVINKPKVKRCCDINGGVLKIGEPCLRTYGYGMKGDPPYPMYLCLKCASRLTDKKIIDALKQWALSCDFKDLMKASSPPDPKLVKLVEELIEGVEA